MRPPTTTWKSSAAPAADFRGLALFCLVTFPLGDAMAEDQVLLQAPDLTGSMSLEGTLQARRSKREFAAGALQRAEVGQLLWAAQGITDLSEGRRTAPSAGALYPLRLYLVVSRVDGLLPGTYYYDPLHHRLERRSAREPRAQLAAAAYGQSWTADSAILVIIAGVEARLSHKYGRRAERYMTLEAGHAAQNLLLQATAMGLGATPVGAFDDAAVAAELRLADGERPLYLLPVGHIGAE